MNEYELELERVINEIKKLKAKRVCIQLAEGLKPKATEIVDRLEKETDAKVLIWLGAYYGACDIPLELNYYNIDLLIQFGHSKWVFADDQ